MCDLFYFFEIDSLLSRNFFLLPSLQKFVFAISSPFQLNFIQFLVFKLIVIVYGVKTWYFYCGKCSLAGWFCEFYCWCESKLVR